MRQRINDWKPEVRSLIKTLRKHGFTIESVNNGVYEKMVDSMAGEAEFLREAVACDEATLVCIAPDGKRVGLYLVFGNDPGELVCDCSSHPDLDKATEEHGELWFGRPQPTIEV
jgi:hypothetical protein